MIKHIITVIFCVYSSLALSQVKTPARFDLTSIPLSQLVSLVYAEGIKTDYVLDPDILNDSRIVSLRYSNTTGDMRPFFVQFLAKLGYSVEKRAGTDYVFKTPDNKTDAVETHVKVYAPRFRSADYLTRVLGSLFSGKFTTSKSISSAVPVSSDAAQSSAAGMIQAQADVLVFSGSADDVAKLEKLLPQVDTQVGQVSVRAAVYEVQNTGSEGSVFQIFASLLNGRLGITLNQSTGVLPNSISIKAGGFEGILSALATDSRFKSLTQPRLRVNSGEVARLVVGQEVPILGSVTNVVGGNAVQSVDYRSAGAILDLNPIVYGDSVDLRLGQQISNFIQTNTGLNNTPTLVKRELKTVVSAKFGDLIVLGGLTENKETGNTTGVSFFPQLFGRSNSVAATDVLVLIQLDGV